MRRPRADATDPRSQAYGILLRVETGGAYAGILLDHAERQLGDPRGSALLHRIVMDVLRRRSAIDHAIAAVANRPPEELDPPVRTALRVGAHGLLYLDRVPDFAAVSSAVDLVKGGPCWRGAGFVNAVLRKIAARGRDLLPAAPVPGDIPGLATWGSHPEWWTRRIVERLGWETAVRLIAANNEPAATVLRPRLARTDVAQLVDRLAADGVNVEPGLHDPRALRVVAGSLRGTRALEEGLAWVQDEASQLVPQLLGPATGGRIADLCAAPGTKSALLADASEPGTIVVAADRHAGRLGRLARLARRLGLDDRILPVCADLESHAAPFAPVFDAVLVDAPCSGTGTLRRHPEIRFRLDLDRIEALAARQSRLLATAARLVQPGGRLVYSVCSVEPEEGAGVARGFLERHGEFEIGDPRAALPAGAHGLVGEDGFLHTSPVEGGLDGFFAALFMRR